MGDITLKEVSVYLSDSRNVNAELLFEDVELSGVEYPAIESDLNAENFWKCFIWTWEAGNAYKMPVEAMTAGRLFKIFKIEIEHKALEILKTMKREAA